MVGRQTHQMDSGNCSVTVVDDSPGSSPSSSPDSRRAAAGVLHAGGLGAGRGRPAAANAARERSRVQTLRTAFLELQRTLPSVPPDTKLSKLDVLILATTYIAHLTRTLQEEGTQEGDSTKQTEALRSLKGEGYLHPVKVGHTHLYIIITNMHVLYDHVINCVNVLTEMANEVQVVCWSKWSVPEQFLTIRESRPFISIHLPVNYIPFA
ncbi:transcription factor 21 isoform X1 [Nerophis lumbriciformis]|uniref:transcription factor 21 isoform X1 n=1 Tax=Nerophis lumbriciformis TaxID=546530 RepID=UPI003BA87892